MCPLVAAAAQRYVPVTIRSAGICIFVPQSFSVPSMQIQSSPAPSIFAPIAFRKRQSHTISGSLAQFRRVVVPFESVAHRIACSVAPTLLFEKTISVPQSFLQETVIFSLLLLFPPQNALIHKDEDPPVASRSHSRPDSLSPPDDFWQESVPEE